MSRGSASLRRAAVGFGLALLVMVAAWSPVNAWAVDDSVNSWTIVYSVQPSGVIHVDETIVYRFGDDSPRHGIDRTLVIREPWADTNLDAIYTIANLTVFSLDASSEFETTETVVGRHGRLQVRIGSPELTVANPTARYYLSYDLIGALRSTETADEAYDEFYWNAIGDATPQVDNVNITVSVPGFAEDAACYTGPVGYPTPCDIATTTPVGTGVFTQRDKPPGAFVTIAVRISPGLIEDNQPHLERRGNSPQLPVGALLTGVLAVLAFFGVPALARRASRDERYVGVPPGVLGDAAGVDDNPVIPVQFTPPDMPLADAGLIDDGATEVRDLTATLLSMAVNGVIGLREVEKVKTKKDASDKPRYVIRATLVDASIDMSEAEAKLLAGLFPRLEEGEERLLTGASRLTKLYDALRKDVREQMYAAGLYKRLPAKNLTGRVGESQSVSNLIAGSLILLWAFVIAALLSLNYIPMSTLLAFVERWWSVGVSVMVVAIGFVVYRVRTRAGRRSALGRAYADQVAGFREYLATAEADQVQFEEGQDIFSQYLPWAVIFGLTKRWVKICEKLVADGRLEALSPRWYGGGSSFDVGSFTRSISSVTRSATASTSSSSSSSYGSGGGSSFGGGGGSSGGGGGGGGVSSW